MKSIEFQFLDFCRSKPADEAYEFCDCNGCAFAQFLIDHGYATQPWCSIGGWTDKSGARHPQPAGFEEVLRDGRCTFGALADRLEAHLTGQGK